MSHKFLIERRGEEKQIMGVYIKGMDMPKGKQIIELRIYADGEVTRVHDLKCRKVAEANEVPEPHGRLIDEDNLIVATKAFLPWSFETEAERGQYFQLDLFKTIIEETPTVIERSNNE